MIKAFDAVVIGSGITGAAIAYELSQKGFKTVNVERLEAAGLGSTGNTCAIIRTHYSTLEGTAIAYDSYFSWKNWADYLGATDGQDLAEFKQTGLINIYPKGHDPSNHLNLHDTLGIPYEIWDIRRLLEKMPHFTDKSFYPPKRPEDPSFYDDPIEKIRS